MKDLLFRGAVQLALRTPLHRLLGRGRRTGAAAELDPQLAAIIEGHRLLRLPAVESMAPADARAFVESELGVLDVPSIAMAKITDTTVAGPAGALPVRIYEPAGASAHWIVYFHGGGGVIGSIHSSDAATRLLAAQTRCTIASVEYRLGPEHKHPAAIHDACAAWDALAARAGRGKLAVAGDSFGGYLAAQVDHHTLATGARRPDLQVLIYPAVDWTRSLDSHRRLADGYLLTGGFLDWFITHYMHAAEDRRAASPMFWSELRGSAPALIVTAGFDPLVDEGDRYVELLRAAGTPVVHRRYPTLIHGFLSMGGGITAARAAIDELCADIRGL
ncbi:MAG TPA: alpha/beta hydrolase, partial [Kofleriaceae bacterium]